MHGTHRPDLRMWEGGGNTPLYKKIPRWKELKKQRTNTRLAQLSLARLRYFIEKGRLDARYPITQRHLHDSDCVRAVRTGVKIFNYNDFPFPYKIDIECCSADQSSIDMIRRVGGSVTIVHYNRIGMKAHLKPWKVGTFKMLRPNFIAHSILKFVPVELAYHVIFLNVLLQVLSLQSINQFSFRLKEQDNGIMMTLLMRVPVLRWRQIRNSAASSMGISLLELVWSCQKLTPLYIIILRNNDYLPNSIF